MDLLSDLPSRGNLVSGCAVHRPPLYICTHNTQPPDNQVLSKPDSDSDIIHMYLKRNDLAQKEKGTEARGKRSVPPASDTAWNRPPKKPHNTDGAGPSGMYAPTSGGTTPLQDSRAVYTLEQLKSKTNKELTDLLKARGLPVSGKKDELIRRLLDYQRRQKRTSQRL